MKTLIKRWAIFVIGILMVSFGFGEESKTATKSDAMAFYKGKVIEFVVPYSPGGGFDTYARMLAPFLENETGATVVVKNMPGGGSILATNYLYKTAKRNGLTLLILPPGIPSINQLLKAQGVVYDCRKFNWLCRVTKDTAIFVVGTGSRYESLDDLRKAEEFKVGTQGKFALSSFRGAIAVQALDLNNAKFIAGYSGSTKVALALLQGEVDCGIESVESTLKFIEARENIPLFVLGREREEEVANVPTIFEAGNLPKTGNKWLDWWIASEEIGRTIVTTPDVPEERVSFLEEVLMKTLNNKDFLKKAAKSRRSIIPLKSKEVEELVETSMKLSPEEVEKLKILVGKKYYK